MAATSLDEEVEREVLKSHRVDSLNLLIFIGLLILTVLTTWLFKHRRIRFLHETGLSVIYGLIVGIIIRYASGTSRQKPVVVAPQPNQDFSQQDIVPEYLELMLCNNNISQSYVNCSDVPKRYFQYKLSTEIKERGKTVNQEVSDKATFDPEIFFNLLLPPIIFNAGYSMKRKHFFRNFGAILTFAFLGTAISAFVVGLIVWLFSMVITTVTFSFADSLFFGALISATDPVTVLAIFSDLNVEMDLYALVFGESVLNDAVAIVLAGTVEQYTSTGRSTSNDHHGIAVAKALLSFLGIFTGAFTLGSVMGCATALLTKYTRIREHPLLETSLFFLMSYSTFLAAEAAGLTGIVAVLFCGICQAHYTFNNLSPESKSRTKQVFELLNLLAENFVFLYIGVSIFTYRTHSWNVFFIAAAFLGILLGRALNIYPLTFLLNLGRSNKIKFNFQHMMMFSGLRGAIAFALAIRNTSTETRQLMFSTTLIIVIVTLLICGGTTMQMLTLLRIRVGVDEEHREMQDLATSNNRMKHYQSVNEGASSVASPTSTQENIPDRPMPRPAVPAVKHAKAWMVLKWNSLDRRFVKPFLTNSRPTLMETLPDSACFQWIGRVLTTDEQLQQGLRAREGATPDESDADLIIDDTELEFGNPGLDAANNQVLSATSSRSVDVAAVSNGGQVQSTSAIVSDFPPPTGRMTEVINPNDVHVLSDVDLGQPKSSIGDVV